MTFQQELNQKLKDTIIEICRDFCDKNIKPVEKNNRIKNKINQINAYLNLGAYSSIKISAVTGYTPLHYAAMMGLNELITLLINHKASLEARNSKGETPIIVAVNNDRRGAAKLLQEAGANLAVIDQHNSNILHLHHGGMGEETLKNLFKDSPLKLFKDLSEQPNIHGLIPAQYNTHNDSNVHQNLPQEDEELQDLAPF